MRTLAVSLLVAFSAHAADGGTPLPESHVVLLPSGACLTEAMACMPGAEAVNFDIELRSAQAERDTLRSAVIWSTAAGVAVTALAVLAAAYAKK
jgi:hypothetical protein